MYHIGMQDALNAVPSQHDTQGFAWFSIKLCSRHQMELALYCYAAFRLGGAVLKSRQLNYPGKAIFVCSCVLLFFFSPFCKRSK